ncbi:MAG: hypothetical protein KJ914_04815 [Gammaproteobacteria bacterium]|nr:hypothetical protein [Gammaproteobacteria bacterium]MBU1724533.1 hypothetical protein [Gammaproteobacteria bacterium]MBU2004576.1 hypothetical protein [Gammaproteobacteria bacterium]
MLQQGFQTALQGTAGWIATQCLRQTVIQINLHSKESWRSIITSRQWQQSSVSPPCDNKK